LSGKRATNSVRVVWRSEDEAACGTRLAISLKSQSHSLKVWALLGDEIGKVFLRSCRRAKLLVRMAWLPCMLLRM